jgi:uncharacterized protein YjiS (DUF1127 family)
MSATTDTMLINCQPAHRVSWPRSLGRTLRLWRARIRERHAFPALEERDLRDLRLSRWEVDRELAKPFWRG